MIVNLFFNRSFNPNNTNKVVVVTGCDTGIGKWLAITLRRWGYEVVAGCLEPESETLDCITEAGAQITRLDVTSNQDIADLVKLLTNLEKNGKRKYN